MASVKPGRRLRLPLVLSLALVAAAMPLGALCASCCPTAGEEETLAERMPCCDDECAPRFVSGSPERPGQPVSVARPVPPAAAILLDDASALPLGQALLVLPSIAASRPKTPGSTPLPLRL